MVAQSDDWRAKCGPVLDALDLPAFLVNADGFAPCVNRRWAHAYGSPSRDAWSILGVIIEEDRDRVRRTLQHALASSRGSELEFQAELFNGHRSLLACSATFLEDPEHGGSVLVCVCWDITERRRHEERLAFMAGHDPLTGLSNRRAFEEALARAVSRMERGGHAALMMLDLDHLKAYNDARGHLEGDQALVNLAMLLRSQVRSGDLPARLGGDEFALLLEDATIEDAEEIAERIRASAASADFVHAAREYHLGVSGGVAAVEPGVDSRMLLDRVDAALYVAKAGGRNSIVRWTPAIAVTGAVERLASKVRTAFAEDGFHLVYQPVMRLADRSVAYFESLVRMQVDGELMLAPSEFLPVVERLGLMPRLTKRIVELASWELAATPIASVSVNLSPADLSDEMLLSEVADIIGAAQACRERLLFEISEPALLANLAGGRAWMERLAPLGCRFVLDDFGTGVGIFVLLREPHISQVKLSRTVMHALAEQESNRNFVSAMRELVESQGKTAVAGFIETDDLLTDARQAGFSWGQGYRLHQPVEGLAAIAGETLGR